MEFICSEPGIGDVYAFENDNYSINVVINEEDTIMRVRLLKVDPKKDMILQPNIKYIKKPFIDVSKVLFMELEETDKFITYFKEAVATCKELEKAINSI